MRKPNVQAIERKKKEKGIKAIFEEIITKNFPKFLKDIKPQIQETPQTPSRKNIKEITPSNIAKNNKIIKATKGTKTHYL